MLDSNKEIWYNITMKAYGIIYKHTNKINGKSYIGQTIQIDNLERRWRRQDSTHRSYNSCPVFKRALNKYSWNNFETELLITAFDQESLNHFEEHFINLFKAMAPTGYNSSMMVDGSVKFTPEIKKKISDKRKEYFANLETPVIPKNRRQNFFVEGKELRNCTECNYNKEVSEFSKNKYRWDNLNTICNKCNGVRNKVWRQKNKLTPEEVKQSYIDRNEKMRIGVQRAYDNNPELSQQKSQQRSKAIIGTNVSTGETIEFSSALEAKSKGFNNANISTSIRKRTIYKNHLWKFK